MGLQKRAHLRMTAVQALRRVAALIADDATPDTVADVVADAVAKVDAAHSAYKSHVADLNRAMSMAEALFDSVASITRATGREVTNNIDGVAALRAKYHRARAIMDALEIARGRIHSASRAR